MKDFDTEKVADLVAERLGRDFKNIKIVTVTVKPDVDHDGQDILRILVVFKGELRKDDARQIATAARRLRPVLKEVDPDLYPLLSSCPR